MKQTLLDVLMLLYKNYVKKEQKRLPQLEEWFSAIGQDSEINIIKKNTSTSKIKQKIQIPQAPLSSRIYAEKEIERLDESCQRYLMVLEQKGIVGPTDRELILHRVMQYQTYVELHELQWIVYKTLVNDELVPHKQIEASIFNPSSNKHLH